MADDIKQQALDYHRIPRPGKLQTTPSKPLDSQHDLALAYSPGVAFPCLEIEKDPEVEVDMEAKVKEENR